MVERLTKYRAGSSAEPRPPDILNFTTTRSRATVSLKGVSQIFNLTCGHICPRMESLKAPNSSGEYRSWRGACRSLASSWPIRERAVGEDVPGSEDRSA